MYERYNKLDNLSSSSIEKEALINSLHSRFEKQKQHYQPDPNNFVGEEGFDTGEIQREVTQAKRLKEKWNEGNNDQEKRNKKVSDVFEGIIVDQFCGAWMANQAEAFFTAEPDDYLRKVDCIIEFSPAEGGQDREYLGLGIDVTFSRDYLTVEHKLDEVWKDVEHSKKIAVKYVDTEHFKGSLEVCRVVVAADKDTVYELARLYKQPDKTQIDNHPFLANIICQIKIQLEAYYNYAKDNNAKSGYLRHVTKTLSTFYRVFDEKKDFIEAQSSIVEQSPVYKTIEKYCEEKTFKK